MSSKRSKVTFEHPKTEDRYDESLEEDIEMDEDLEKELDVLDHLYRMKDKTQRVKKYQAFLQSKYREKDEESVPKKAPEPKLEKFFAPKRQPIVTVEINIDRDFDLIEWVTTENLETLKSDTQYKSSMSHIKLALDTMLNYPMETADVDAEMKKLALTKGDEIQRQNVVFLFYHAQNSTIALMKQDVILNYWMKPKE